MPGEVAAFQVVTDRISDVLGNEVRTSRPRKVGGSFNPNFSVTQSHAFQGWTDHDAFGRVRRAFEDYEAGLGEVVTDYAAPGWSRETDADGYVRLLHSDNHGRINAVQEGRNGNLRITGQWRYDARSRVIGLVDGAGNAYGYGYDGAGRLRSVGRAKAKTGGYDANVNPIGWYAYEYDGPDPIELWEGEPGLGTLAATWSYDTLGRTVEKQVLERATGMYDTYTWGWDTQWIGLRSGTTDPSGHTDYRYDAESLGQLGHLTRAKRTWNDGHSAQFDYVNDFEGRVLKARWPDGREVNSAYGSNGLPVTQTLVNGASTSVNLQRPYDNFGLPRGFTAQSTGQPFSGQNFRTGPTRLDGVLWTVPPGASRRVDYC